MIRLRTLARASRRFSGAFQQNLQQALALVGRLCALTAQGLTLRPAEANLLRRCVRLRRIFVRLRRSFVGLRWSDTLLYQRGCSRSGDVFERIIATLALSIGAVISEIVVKPGSARLRPIINFDWPKPEQCLGIDHIDLSAKEFIVFVVEDYHIGRSDSLFGRDHHPILALHRRVGNLWISYNNRADGPI